MSELQWVIFGYKATSSLLVAALLYGGSLFCLLFIIDILIYKYTIDPNLDNTGINKNISSHNFEKINGALKQCLIDSVNVNDSREVMIEKYDACIQFVMCTFFHLNKVSVYNYMTKHSGSFKRSMTTLDNDPVIKTNLNMPSDISYNSIDDLIKVPGLWTDDSDKPMGGKIDVKFVTKKIYNSCSQELRFFLEVNDLRFYVLYKFLSDHPSSPIKEYDQITSLVNTNNQFSKWYQSVKKEYSTMTTAPDWLKGSHDDLSNWRKEYVQRAIDIKKALRSLESKQVAAEKKYKESLAEIQVQRDEILLGNIDENFAVLIERISKNALPLKRIEKYLNSTPEVLEKKLEVELKKYKLELFNGYKSGTLSEADLRNELVLALLND
jgi:hypothetical protein